MRLNFYHWRQQLARGFKKVPQPSRLPLALGMSVVFALLLTVVSVDIYASNGSSKLDLSRPGFEHERQEVRATDSQKTYDTTSAINRKAIDDFLQEYDSRTKDLSEYGDFRDQALNDTDLQLETNQ